MPSRFTVRQLLFFGLPVAVVIVVSGVRLFQMRGLPASLTIYGGGASMCANPDTVGCTETALCQNQGGICNANTTCSGTPVTPCDCVICPSGGGISSGFGASSAPFNPSSAGGGVSSGGGASNASAMGVASSAGGNASGGSSGAGGMSSPNAGGGSSQQGTSSQQGQSSPQGNSSQANGGGSASGAAGNSSVSTPSGGSSSGAAAPSSSVAASSSAGGASSSAASACFNASDVSQYRLTFAPPDGWDSTYQTPATCENTPPAGGNWTLADAKCTAKLSGVCYAELCLWKKSASKNADYAVSGAGNGADCSTSPPAGYSLATDICMHATSNGCAFTYCLWLKASSPPAVLSLTSNGGASMCAGDYCVYKQYPSPGSCQSSSSNYNTSSNSSSASSQGVCGNGQLEGAEECDDGNTKNGDGCDAACHVENGYVCTVQSSGADTCMTVCGDGIVAGSEGCDDGPNNGKSGDACSAVCTVNQGFVCSFNGSSQGLNSAIWQMATSVSSSSFGHVFRQTCDPTVVNGISCGCPGEPTCGSVNSSASPLSMAPASQRFAVFLRLPALAS